MAKKTREVTEREIIDSLRKTGARVAMSARKLGMSYQGLYKRINAHENLKEALQDIREHSLDLVEDKLWDDVERGEHYAICFYLKCQGKHRGWVETVRNEHSGPDGGPIQTEDKKPDYSKLSKDELRQLHELYEKLYAKD
ncbi:MAG: hypothetical protein BWX71_01267 [Deltaproteobacteria bacterium ADurb.Bin072]|nr:MAG: hypothetical protein BWX71_01267 [Deltaproteobacteria bacterium ADurb.Bin072]